MKYSIIAFFTLIFVFSGCKKEPGFGGNANVKGTVWVKNYNTAFTFLLGEYPGADEDVYLLVDGEINPLERIRANYNGQFEFPFLYPGKYQVYIYTKDSSANAIPGIIKPVMREFEITENRQVVNLDTLVKFDN